MPEETFEERTDPATPHKKGEARQRGHVPRSQDLSAAVILLAAVIALNIFGREFVKTLLIPFKYFLQHMPEMASNPDTIVEMIIKGSVAVGIAFFPFIIIVTIAALAINILQVGFVISFQPLTPDLNKLNPISGIRKLFTLRNLMVVLVGLLKVAAIGTVTYFTLWGERVMLVNLLDMEFQSVVKYMIELVFILSVRCTMALLFIGFIDYLYQRWQYERDLRMSKMEIKEELKRFEGDPKIKERRRAVHRQLVLQRMFQKVPRATVVITNPTEIAIALEYSKGMAAPVVVAKGMGLIAERIRRIAFENDVPIIQRPELARALYRLCEVDDVIPENLYKAVAEILAYVISLRQMQGFAPVK